MTVLFFLSGFKKDRVEHEKRHPQDNGRIRDIEGGPVVRSYIKIQKINDVREAHPVAEIACRAPPAIRASDTV